MEPQTLIPVPLAGEHDTEPMKVVKKCGVRGCENVATAFVCEMCQTPLCEVHKRVSRFNSEDFVACPKHNLGGE